MQTTSGNTHYNADGKVQKTSTISHEFHSFLADIEDLFKATTSLTGDDLARAKAKLSERIDAAKETAEELSENIVQRARKTADITNHYAHEQPWAVIGAGAAVSFLLGYLLARRA